MEEIFLHIKDFPMYEVSNKGNVKSLYKNKLMKQKERFLFLLKDILLGETNM